MRILTEICLRLILPLLITIQTPAEGLDSRIFYKKPLAFLNFAKPTTLKGDLGEPTINNHMNKGAHEPLSAEASDEYIYDSFYYPDDDGKLILTGIEVHVQLASPYKAFCPCRSIASPVTTLNVTKNPDIYRTEPAENRKRVYEGFKRVLEDIVQNYKPSTSLSKTHFDSETPLKLEDYIKWYYDTKSCETYTDVDERELNELVLRENEFTCPGCRGEVGALPYISPMSLLYAVGVCKVLDCEIANNISFDRKCYEYFDLPKGYQVTQTLNPLGRNGRVKLSTGKVVTVSKVQFEEDTARRLENDDHPRKLDFNRSGVALAEIVTKACELTRSEILETCRSIHQALVLNGLSNGNRFRGNFRFDINLSRPDGTNRIEVKNLNSFVVINKSVKDYDPEKDYAIKSEKPAETSVLGKLVAAEGTDKPGSLLDRIKNVFLSVLKDIPNKEKYTPLGTTMKWDKEMGLQPTRHKLSSESYGNYFETNIPVIYQSDDLIKRFTDCLPKDLKVLDKFLAKYPNVNKELLKEIYRHQSWTEYFEKLCLYLDPQVAASQFVNSLLPVVKSSDVPLMPAERFAELLKLVLNHKLNLSDLDKVLPELMDYQGSFEDFLARKNLLLYDMDRTMDLIDKYLKANPLDHSKSSDSGYITRVTTELVHSADSKISYQFVRDYVTRLLKE